MPKSRNSIIKKYEQKLANYQNATITTQIFLNPLFLKNISLYMPLSWVVNMFPVCIHIFKHTDNDPQWWKSFYQLKTKSIGWKEKNRDYKREVQLLFYCLFLC